MLADPGPAGGRLAGLDGEFSRRAVDQDLDRRADFDAGIRVVLSRFAA